MKTLHLFAGAGGGLLADLILGHEPVAAVEWDAYCCQVLRERAAEGWFPDLQVFEGDVRLFDASAWKGCVDCIHAGFPCQDISVAGKRAGVEEGTRSGLYREVLRVADVVRPRFLFLENVSAILSNGLGTVLGDLAARGYDARWCCLRASDVGANHRRDRWWMLAYAKGREINERERGDVAKETGGREGVHATVDACGADVADTAHHRREWTGQQADNAGSRRDPIAGGRVRWEEAGSWWDIEPDLGRVANGVASRVDRLKGLGNGQVPLQAAIAFRALQGLLE